jgi:hypothetical protein
MGKKKFIWIRLYFTVITAVIIVIIGVLDVSNSNFPSVAPAVAQRISPSDIWKLVYEEFPSFPRENQYISKNDGNVAESNTLAGRLIRYHIYIKGRSPIYRFDWKLTLADYLNANEIMYESSYPGANLLTQNPLQGDRDTIAKLTRQERNQFVQVMVNIFNPQQN